MFACSRCKKTLSSRQALQYHMNSNKCIAKSSSYDKMLNESEITIHCTLDGYINDYHKKGTPLRSSSIIGKSLYDSIDDSCKYVMSLKHIQALSHVGDVCRLESVTINGLLCRHSMMFSCILVANGDSLTVYLSDGKAASHESD